VILLGIAMLSVPRRFALVPILILCCYVSHAQRLVIAQLDFTLVRMLVIFGWTRVLYRREARGVKWTSIDTWIVVGEAVGTIAYCSLHGTVGAVIYRLGATFDVLGLYFLCRILIRDLSDIRSLTRGFVLVTPPLILAFAYEYWTENNIFAIFGGVPAISMFREGRTRCQGAFTHPIMAGVFFASMLPLVVALWWRRGTDRLLSVVGTVTTLGLVGFSSSSTPAMGVAAGMAGAAAFLLRYRMRLVRWGIVGMLVALAFAMQKPVWHIIARISVFGGSTGWHRYYLIDNAFAHLGEWALIGTKSTTHWGMGMRDITNHYISQGVLGGLGKMLILIVVIVLAYRCCGRIWRALRPNRANVILGWAVGVTLFMHTAMFVAVTYFGQVVVVWWLCLGMIVSLYETKVLRPKRVRRPAVRKVLVRRAVHA